MVKSITALCTLRFGNLSKLVLYQPINCNDPTIMQVFKLKVKYCKNIIICYNPVTNVMDINLTNCKTLNVYYTK